MTHSLRLSLGAALLVAAAACSGSPDKPALSADLEQDLARAGGANVELAGGSASRTEVVSAEERVESPTPAPKGAVTMRAASKERGKRAVAPTKRGTTPVSAPSRTSSVEAPVEQQETEVQPTTTPMPQGRPEAPIPSRQPEPRGGWKTPGEVIRNAPFPINP